MPPAPQGSARWLRDLGTRLSPAGRAGGTWLWGCPCARCELPVSPCLPRRCHRACPPGSRPCRCLSPSRGQAAFPGFPVRGFAGIERSFAEGTARDELWDALIPRDPGTERRLLPSPLLGETPAPLSRENPHGKLCWSPGIRPQRLQQFLVPGTRREQQQQKKNPSQKKNQKRHEERNNFLHR